MIVVARETAGWGGIDVWIDGEKAALVVSADDVESYAVCIEVDPERSSPGNPRPRRSPGTNELIFQTVKGAIRFVTKGANAPALDAGLDAVGTYPGGCWCCQAHLHTTIADALLCNSGM